MPLMNRFVNTTILIRLNRAQAVPVAVHSALLQASPDELKAAILLFYGLLDEQQRRLFAGLESIRCWIKMWSVAEPAAPAAVVPPRKKNARHNRGASLPSRTRYRG